MSPIILEFTINGEALPLKPLSSVPYAQRAAEADRVADNSIDTSSISSNSITNAKIATNAVTDAKISGTISAAKLDLSGVQKKYAKVAVVAQSGGDFTSPLTAMGSVATWCGTPSASNPCLLKIMPGVYNMGANSLTMQPYTDIEGSGEGVTKIAGTSDNESVGVIIGASNVELRFLSVESTSSASAIYNDNASPRLTHVSAISSGSLGANFAVSNVSSSPTMRDVSIISSGTDTCYGVYNFESSPVITNLRITTGSTCSGYGIYNRDHSFPYITDLHAVISGNIPSYGIFNDHGCAVTLKNSAIYAVQNQDTVTAIRNQSGGTAYIVSTKLEGNIYDPASGIVYEGTIYRIAGSPTVKAASRSAKGLVVQGVAVQEANLQEWQDMEGGTILASISPQGVLSLPANGLVAGSTQLVLSGGKVGLGTAMPSQMLEVVGTVKATSFSGDGSGLTGVTLADASVTTVKLNIDANLNMHDKNLSFRGDIYHGLGWYGAGKLFGTSNPDGPVLFGNMGGILGTNAANVQKQALTWDNNGNVSVTGTLSKGSGSFKIDHPLDPKNKYLYHSFVESPDMMNIYNGNITTDANGFATVEMPDWFEALEPGVPLPVDGNRQGFLGQGKSVRGDGWQPFCYPERRPGHQGLMAGDRHPQGPLC